MEDKKEVCKDCGTEYIIEVGEQKWLEDKGFTLPLRCPECRRKRRELKLKQENKQ